MLSLMIILAAYLVGAIPFGYLVARWRGVDILHAGSGNIGATNVVRVLGWRWGLLVFVLDFAKGASPVLAARLVPDEFDWPPDTLPVAAGVAAFLGHLFPVYLGFRGGKGVATSLGVLLGFAWPVGLACVATWLITAVVSRFSSLAALCAAFMAPLYMHWYGAAQELLVATVIMTTLLVWRHRGNIQNLLNGTETKIRARY